MALMMKEILAKNPSRTFLILLVVESQVMAQSTRVLIESPTNAGVYEPIMMTKLLLPKQKPVANVVARQRRNNLLKQLVLWDYAILEILAS